MTKEELFEKNKIVLKKYIPENAVEEVCRLIFEYDFKLIVKKERKSKWGDFHAHPEKYNCPVITINKNLNPYAFLITLIHEIAHCKTYREFGNKVNAHGSEWKKNFQLLMHNFLNTEIFPIDVLFVLRKHMQNPSASANADIKLYKVLLHYDEWSLEKNLLEYLNDGDKFQYDGIVYQKIIKRRKKIECIQVSTGKKYLFSPVTEVEVLID
ncbi:MAG: sprT domain-containing protein [Bacteroidia bacterium]|nr:sprT domain-containing protein [Bacteroidia bacterium]